MQNNPYTKEAEKDIEREKERVKDFASQAIDRGEEKARGVASTAKRKIRQSEEQIRQLASDVDRQLHENPWPLVTGIAASCLLLGFVMGITKKS